MQIVCSSSLSALTTRPRRFPLFIAVGVVMVLLMQFIEIVRVSGDSMNPTLHNGQVLLSFKRLNTYERENVVILRPPRELQTRAPRFVKRLIAMPGDTVSVRDNNVYLNGQVLNEPYALESSVRADSFPEVLVSNGEVVAFEGFALAELPTYLRDTVAMLSSLPKEILEKSYTEPVTYVGTIKLAKEHYFVLGDNRGFSASEDSRLFGVVSRQHLLGKAQL